MIIALYIVAAVVMAVGSLYFAWQNREFRKFLAGAFFVSSGILFYLYLAMFQCLCWGQILSKHLRLAVADRSSISSSSCSLCILASSGR
jgi:cytochrome bd-type quinol oxidase subunit 2